MIADPSPLRRVLILADESASWKVAGLPQLQRLLLCLNEYAESVGERIPISVCVWWKDGESTSFRIPGDDPRLTRLEISVRNSGCRGDDEQFDLVLGTRLFLYRNSVASLRETLNGAANTTLRAANDCWRSAHEAFQRKLAARAAGVELPWRYLSDQTEIPACERAFLRQAGKTQDGLISRHINRPVSRWLSRYLLKLPLQPSTWSLAIFVLPLLASVALLSGDAGWIIIGCAIFQLYSILDGCDGEIARAKFLQTDFGRRLDSACDFLGNMLLAACLGIGLARQAQAAGGFGWLYAVEGAAAAFFVVLSEGIVFARRNRGEERRVATTLNGALYQRHHELFERSGILALGENVAWWLLVLTKRDMALLAFVVLAMVGWPEAILHLLLGVGAINSALAGNAFFRAPAPAPAIQQEAS